jgi:hypothetical protein
MGRPGDPQAKSHPWHLAYGAPAKAARDIRPVVRRFQGRAITIVCAYGPCGITTLKQRAYVEQKRREGQTEFYCCRDHFFLAWHDKAEQRKGAA